MGRNRRPYHRRDPNVRHRAGVRVYHQFHLKSAVLGLYVVFRLPGCRPSRHSSCAAISSRDGCCTHVRRCRKVRHLSGYPGNLLMSAGGRGSEPWWIHLDRMVHQSYNEPQGSDGFHTSCSGLLGHRQSVKYSGFAGWDYNIRDYNARDYNARDYNARDYNARDYNARDYNARDYNAQGRNIVHTSGIKYNQRDSHDRATTKYCRCVEHGRARLHKYDKPDKSTQST
jgi:hypothetical protein